MLQYSGAANFLEPRWWNVGAAKLGGEDLNYLGVAGLRIAGGQGILIIAVCQVCRRSRSFVRRRARTALHTAQPDTPSRRQVLLMFGPEYARSCGIEALEPLGVYLPGDKNYPGNQESAIARVFGGNEVARCQDAADKSHDHEYALSDAGGILFDPFGLSKDVAAFEDNKVKEIKNGRLAMVAWAGFFAQVSLVWCLLDVSSGMTMQ